MDETIEAFEELKQIGKIRQYGISSIRPNVIQAYVNRSAMVSVMMQYSLLDRRPEETCLDLLHQHSIGVLTRGSLAQGLLVDKPAKPYLSHSLEEVKYAADAIQALIQPGRTATQAALRFALHHPAVCSAVTGIRTMEQLQDSLDIQHSPRLTEAEFLVLSQSAKPTYYTEHRV